MKYNRIENRVLELKKVLRVIDALPDDVEKKDVVTALLGMESFPINCLKKYWDNEESMVYSGYAVYAIMFRGVNKIYIGQSKNYIHRIGDHMNYLRAGSHVAKRMQADYNEHVKSDKDVIVHVIQKNLTKEEAKRLESVYISLYDTTNPDKGYNTSKGAEIGDVCFVDGAPILL